MNIGEELRTYLTTTGESMRSLSLRSGLGKKAVADIINIDGIRPRRKTLVALSSATGLNLENSFALTSRTYAELIKDANEVGNKGLATKLKWLCRNAKWVEQTKITCKQDVVDFFKSHSAGSFNLSKGSYATYKSAILAAVVSDVARQRKRGITDIGGLHREIFDHICDSDISKSLQLKSGSFLVYLHDQLIDPADINSETLAAYYNHRIAISAHGEDVCEKHVKEIARLLETLATRQSFQGYGFRSVRHPFADGRNEYGVSDADIAEIMAEFDLRVGPWALGQTSRDGKTKKDFLAELDSKEAPVTDRKAQFKRARQEKKSRPGQTPEDTRADKDEILRQNGFLTGKQTWNGNTLKVRRGNIVSLAKALVATVDMAPVSIEELTDPDFLDAAAEAIEEKNAAEFASGYVGSVLKCARKLAVGYVGRPPEDIEKIDGHIKFYDRPHKGIAPRNRSKLKQFTDARIQDTIDLSGMAIAEINRNVGQLRQMHRAKHGTMPASADVFTVELVRDVMAVIAHDILLTRAPRSSNVTEARLDWLVEHEGRMRLIVPSEKVKSRGAQDADLVIPLSESASKLLRLYLGQLREKALTAGDERNPYLFPSQKGSGLERGKHYGSILQRVTSLLEKHVHVRIHPHLYRHLIGWIWLRESTANLPKVKILLGHTSLQTTLDYYAELDESLVLDQWQEYINGEKTV